HVFCRFFSRALRVDGAWKLLTFEVLFERDIMRAVNPADALPIDWAVLKTLRPSYCFLAYMQLSRGVEVNPDLLGDDRPEQLAAVHAGEEAWLAAESRRRERADTFRLPKRIGMMDRRPARCPYSSVRAAKGNAGNQQEKQSRRCERAEREPASWARPEEPRPQNCKAALEE